MVLKQFQNEKIQKYSIMLREIFIYLTILVYPLLDMINQEFIPGIKKIFAFFIVSYAILLLVKNILNRSKIDNEISKIGIIYSVLILYMCFSFLYAVDKSGVFNEIVTYVSYGSMFYIVFDYIKEEAKVLKVLNIFISSTYIPLLVGAYQIIFNNGYKYYGGINRAIGTLGHTSTYGHYLVIFCILFLVIMISNNDLYNIKKIRILFGISVVMLFFTYTRSSWVLFAIILLLVLFKYNKKYLRNLMYIGLAALPFVGPKIYERFAWEFSVKAENSIVIGPIVLSGSYASRLHFIIFGFNEMFLTSPIWGHGIGSFFYTYSLPVFGLYVEMHCDFVKILAEIGIIGFVLYVLIYYNILKILFRYIKLAHVKYKEIIGSGIFITIFLLIGQVVDAFLRLQAVMWTFTIVIAICMATVKLNNEKKIIK